jgi:hypothetical protein
LVPAGPADGSCCRRRSRDSSLGACSPPGSVPVSRPRPSCGFASTFQTHDRAPLQGFVPRMESVTIVVRSIPAPSEFPSRVFSSAALAHGFFPGPSSRVLCTSRAVRAPSGTPESCVAAESACHGWLPTLLGFSTFRSRGVDPPRDRKVAEPRRVGSRKRPADSAATQDSGAPRAARRPRTEWKAHERMAREGNREPGRWRRRP